MDEKQKSTLLKLQEVLLRDGPEGARTSPLWRAECYASSQHHTLYVAAPTLADAARLADPLVRAVTSEGEAQPAVNLVLHGEVSYVP